MSDNKDLQMSKYKFKGFSVRSGLDQNGNIWFVAKDVCDVLEIANVSDAISRLDSEDKSDTILNDVTGQFQSMLIISEPGLYELIRDSRKPEAKAFQTWVLHEVLPSIRKYGAYMNRIFIELCVISRQEAIPDVKTYFIRCNDKVKIGRTQDVQRRLKALQTANPDTLTLLGYIEGDLERYLHNKFQKHHFRGEWYYLDQEIMDFIKKETIL